MTLTIPMEMSIRRQWKKSQKEFDRPNATRPHISYLYLYNRIYIFIYSGEEKDSMLFGYTLKYILFNSSTILLIFVFQINYRDLHLHNLILFHKYAISVLSD